MFKRITNSSEPKIIGVNNGVYQVEIDEEDIKIKSLVNDELDKLITQVNFNDYLENREKIFELDIRLKGELLKKAKITDIMGYTPYFFGFHYLVSQKFVDCLIEKKVSKDEYHLIPVDIKNLDIEYYFLYVPWINTSEIIFEESLIYNTFDAMSENKKYFDVRNHDAYIELQEKEPLNSFDKVVLDKKYMTNNIISIQGISELFFSDNLINCLENKKTSSFEVKEKVMLSFK